VWKLAYIYNEFAQLLAHPLQRVNQNEMDFRLPGNSPTKSLQSSPSTSQSTVSSQSSLSPSKQASPVKVVKVESQLNKPVEERGKSVSLQKEENQGENKKPDNVNELEEISKL
jgi:hypothetical protein